MAARLTDKQKKKIIADYVITNSYNAAAKMNGVSWETAKRVVSETEDIEKILDQKKEENTADILTYMENQKTAVCEIIGIYLTALKDPEKVEQATLNQITTALGTLVDKWAMVNGTGTNEQTNSHNALIDAIRKRNNED